MACMLYKYHSGFHSNFSVDFCFGQLTDFILRRKDKVIHNGTILIDLQKAFDTLNQAVLLQKWDALVLRSQ